ncbi:hypothetical protein GUJ93_ZPchr0013g37123 [Zizania palustris]|uniref:Uncharacterized protein n=1 Tax=Zizania palustris TaxID=103762 RepID=A0A8J5WZ53_ZIZPA|nr:hypothetical protein GUJ93_ZPchr0013g37123 [Zizania palustris]
MAHKLKSGSSEVPFSFLDCRANPAPIVSERTDEEVRAVEPEALMSATIEVVAAKEEATRVAAPLLGSLGDSGAEFFRMFEYTSSPVQSSTSVKTSEALRLGDRLADSEEKASSLEDALQQERERWAAFEVEAENLRDERDALAAEVQKLQAQKDIFQKRSSELVASNSELSLSKW